MILEPGTSLSHYRILERIGEGAMGVVWKALDSNLGRHVALKVLPDAVAAEPERLALFEREARALAALNHPNIVTLHSVEEAEGVRFITMELVSGKTLAELIPREGLAPSRLIEYAKPLADGLAAAHDGGVVHRDLKPSNIIVGTDGRLRILDFGLAELHAPRTDPALGSGEVTLATLSKLSQTDRLRGTFPYMSPEQLQGKPPDHRSDLFSLGVVLHEMATGSLPFGGASAAEVMSAILRDEPRPIAETKPGFPEGLDRIVGRCLVKDPAQRCQSAREVRDALADLYLSGSLPRSGTQPRRSPRRPAVLVALLSIALVAVAAVLWTRRTKVEAVNNAVAILPFTNLTGDASKDSLADGISAGLIAQLSEISGIRVAARAATSTSKGQPPDFASLESRFGIGLFLEGEVQQSGEDLRVDVKLTDADSNLVLWSESFRDSSAGVFALQKEIAYRLTAVLSIPLSRIERDRLARDPAGSLKAWEYFVKADQKLDARDPRSLDDAVNLLEQALRLDPRFALAHASLSEALWQIYRRDAKSEKLQQAEKEARRALEIDPGLPAAQTALARVLRATGHSAESIGELQKVLGTHPHPDEAWRQMALSYERMGDIAEAEKCYRTAVSVGDKDWSNWNALGSFLLTKRARYREAREAFEKSIELAPKSITIPLQNLAATVFSQGRFDEAVDRYESLPKPIRRADLASNLGTSYYFSSRPDKLRKAEEYFRQAVDLDPANATVRRNLADVLVDLGRRPAALENYREALRLTEDQLRNDPGSFDLRLDQAQYAAKSEQCDKAVYVSDALAKELPQTAENVHSLAYAYALCARESEAIDALEGAIRLGYSPKIIREESEFKGLVNNPRFVKLCAANP